MSNREANSRRLSLALLSTVSLGVMTAAASAQQDVSESGVLSASPYAGIRVINGANATGTNVVVNQSPSNVAVDVVDGSVSLSGGSITQERQDGGSIGVVVRDGSAALDGTTINVKGGIDSSGINVLGEGTSIEAKNVGINVVATTTNVATGGSPTAGVKADNGSINISDSTVAVTGIRGYGLLAASNSGAQASVTSTNNTITTNGERAFGAYAFADISAPAGNGSLVISGGSIETDGTDAWGLLTSGGANARINASNGLEVTTNGLRGYGAYALTGSMVLDDVDISTLGIHAYGAYAQQGGTISMTGGSVRTLNETGRGTQDGDGSRGYALFASGTGSRISATGTVIETLGQRAYGAYAIGGGTIDLTDVQISTDGFMAYGVYASGANSVLTANNVNITTNGQVGDAAWAYLGGRLNLYGGVYTVVGEQNPNAPGEVANGLVAVGGTAGVDNGTIVATGLTVQTSGANSSGLKVGSVIGSANTSGSVSFSNGSVSVSGDGSTAASVAYGSDLTVAGSTLTSRQGVGVRVIDNATVAMTGARVEAGQEAFVSSLRTAGQTQAITLGDGSVATQNNGTLLLVERSEAGADGEVQFVLGAGSTTSGDILDEGARTTGGTDVTVEQGASWTGTLRGVRNFFGLAGGDVEYEGLAVIEGNVTGQGTRYTFSPEGAQIGGNVELNGGSSTTGGTIENRINVAGNVAVDPTSTMGGNWAIGGDLANAGTLSPGNSIGRVSVGGDLNLSPTSRYDVDIDGAGNADRVDVAGTANLDGSVRVTPLGGFVVDQPYTILTAGSRVGEFDAVSLSPSYAFLGAGLSYDPNTVYLTIERNGVAFASVARTGNQAAAAAALDSLPLTNDLARTLALSTAGNAASAFDQVSGEIHASTRGALLDGSRHVRDSISSRIDGALGNVAQGADVVGTEGRFATSGLWVDGFGSFGEADGNSNAARADRDVGGVFLGYDRAVTDNSLLGVFGGYSRTDIDVDARRSSAQIDTGHVGVYGAGGYGVLEVSAGAAYAWNRVDTERSVAFPGFSDQLTASYDADTAQVFGEIGTRFVLGGLDLKPFAGLAYVHLDADGFTEQGGAARLSTGSQSSDATFTTLGLRASHETVVAGREIAVRGMAGWRHASGDTTPTSTSAFVTGLPFTVAGAPISKNAAVVEAGFSTEIVPNVSFTADYVGQFGEDSTDNGFRIGLSSRF